MKLSCWNLPMSILWLLSDCKSSNRIVAAETLWPEKPKRPILGPSQKEFANPWLKMAIISSLGCAGPGRIGSSGSLVLLRPMGQPGQVLLRKVVKAQKNRRILANLLRFRLRTGALTFLLLGHIRSVSTLVPWYLCTVSHHPGAQPPDTM